MGEWKKFAPPDSSPAQDAAWDISRWMADPFLHLGVQLILDLPCRRHNRRLGDEVEDGRPGRFPITGYHFPCTVGIFYLRQLSSPLPVHHPRHAAGFSSRLGRGASPSPKIADISLPSSADDHGRAELARFSDALMRKSWTAPSEQPPARPLGDVKRRYTVGIRRKFHGCEKIVVTGTNGAQ